MTNTRTPRPSHLLPDDMFDAIMRLEEAARDDATMLATINYNPDEYVARVAYTGQLRDELAALLLEAARR